MNVREELLTELSQSPLLVDHVSKSRSETVNNDNMNCQDQIQVAHIWEAIPNSSRPARIGH